ncbi:hypothetical protein LX36DRAFT_148302 [Colletotrichum falcatum]|nr:hypothetical protein LX36DRAFT_148302 [Colletotrichum falcatum]
MFPLAGRQSLAGGASPFPPCYRGNAQARVWRGSVSLLCGREVIQRPRRARLHASEAREKKRKKEKRKGSRDNCHLVPETVQSIDPAARLPGFIPALVMRNEDTTMPSRPLHETSFVLPPFHIQRKLFFHQSRDQLVGWYVPVKRFEGGTLARVKIETDHHLPPPPARVG